MSSTRIYTSAFQPALGHIANQRRTNLDAQQPSQAFPVLTIEEMQALNFEPPHDCAYFSWSPKKALDARENGEVGTRDGWETLHTYLTDTDYRSVAAGLLLQVKPLDLPNPDALMRIYRITDSESGSGFGAILPGAAVSESAAHAQCFADAYPDKKPKMLSTMVYPDELVTHGNPHDFIYIPRSLKVGFERYLADVKRHRDAELAEAGRD